MQIKINKCEFRNFLSYGHQWQSIDCTSGITFITGNDDQKHRSNGSGKTSLMEVIPFALFGVVTKNIKKSEIVNWKNGKKCEVKIEFSKGSDEYTVRRGIKPAIFKIYKNDNEVNTTSHVRDFQSWFEDEVLNIDFKGFVNLIHSNPNNTISLLNTPKAQKRQFIEKLFDLAIFSKLGKHVHEKLKSTNTKINTAETGITHNNDMIAIHQKDIDNTTSVDTTEEKEELKRIESDYDEQEYSDCLDEIHNETKHLEQCIQEKTEAQSDFQIVDQDIQLLEKEIKLIDKNLENIGDISESEAKAKEVQEFIDILVQTDYDNEVSMLNNQVESLDLSMGEVDIELQKVSDRESEIKGIKQGLPDPDKLMGKSKCPTCASDVDYDDIKEVVEVEVKKLNEELVGLDEAGNNLQDGYDKLNNEQDGYNVEINLLRGKKEKLGKLELILSKLDVKKDREDIERLNGEKRELFQRKDELINDYENFADTLQQSTDEVSESKFHIEGLENIKSEAEENLRKINHLKKEIKRWVDFQKEQDSKSKGKLNDIKDLRKGIKSFDRELKTLKIIHDYLEYIKLSCGDSQIKQFAISNYIPFIQERVNYYLSECGHSFIVKLDDFLEARILGPGVSDISYGNLSGGESKSIDLAMKLACGDIARIQSSSSMDVLIFDELLDSSLDSYGLEQLMNIIRLKQKDDDLKVFIISHRDELEMLEADNLIRVSKSDGFSTINTEEM